MLSLVIPVYKNEDTIPALLDALTKLHERLGRSLEVIFVVDGSPDGSHDLLRRSLPDRPFSSELVSLSRNFGSFAAMRTGLSVGRGPYFAVMAADLQEPSELIDAFFAALREDPVDVVFGQRQDREDPIVTKFSAQIFWALYRRFVNRDIPVGGVDVFACSRTVRDALLRLEEVNSSLIGQLFWLGFRRKYVPYTRGPRHGGSKSAWTWRKKYHYMMDSIFAFTDLPITLLLAVGAFGIVASTGISIMVFICWLMGAIPVMGYTPIMLMIGFSTSLLLLGMGILGGYLYRTFENTKRRPLALLMQHESFRKDPP